MALETKKKLDWTDIEAIYTSLNEAREQFQMPTVSVVNQARKRTLTTDATTLEAEIVAMSENDYISKAIEKNELTIPDIEDPQRKTKMYPGIFNDMKDIIADILEVCPHTERSGGGGDTCSLCHGVPFNSAAHGGSGFNWYSGGASTGFSPHFRNSPY